MLKLLGVSMAALALASCSTVPERRVDLPPVGAGPEAVVRAYVDALDARDIDAARALLTAEHAATVEDAEDSWFTNVDSITDLEVTAPVRVEPTRTFPQRAAVYVEFDLRQERAVSVEDGRVTWGYFLTRAADGQRWLIDDEGVG